MPFSTDFFESINSYQGRQWFDSHCHFDFKIFDSDREKHWRSLQALGCKGLLIPGVKAKDWPRLINLCDSKPWYYALGLHPYFLDDHELSDLDELRAQCSSEVVDQKGLVAIGEIGLDFSLLESTRVLQIEYFTKQLLLAQELKLPVILHARKSYDVMHSIIRKVGFTQGGVVHAFTGSFQQGKALINMGFKLGMGGALSHSRAKRLRKTVIDLPYDSIVLETDSPDMKPAFLSSDRNTPASILLIAQITASLQKRSLSDVLDSSNKNLVSIFPKMEAVNKAKNHSIKV